MQSSFAYKLYDKTVDYLRYHNRTKMYSTNTKHILSKIFSGNTLRSIQSIEDNHGEETSGSFNKIISISCISKGTVKLQLDEHTYKGHFTFLMQHPLWRLHQQNLFMKRHSIIYKNLEN